jgi:hypothetical protein
MEERYRLFLRRKSVYYAFDTTTRRFQSLQTKDRKEAERVKTLQNQSPLTGDESKSNHFTVNVRMRP